MSNEMRQMKRRVSTICNVNEFAINCSTSGWVQYQKHKVIFNLIRQKIISYAGYYSTYKELLGKFYGAVRLFDSASNTQDINH
jgi:hypothetical protein